MKDGTKRPRLGEWEVRLNMLTGRDLQDVAEQSTTLPVCRLTYTCLVLMTALFMLASFCGAARAQAFGTTKLADIDLGTGIAPATFSGTYYNTIGTNGTIQYAAGFSGPATGIAGAVRINGPIGTAVQVSCETGGTTRNTGGCCGSSNRTVYQTKFVVGTANAVGPGLGTACAGLSTSPVNHTITGNAAQDTVLIGGRMLTTNVKIGGQYSTATGGGGDPVTVRVRRVSPGSNSDQTVHYLATFDSSIAFSATQNMLFGTINFATVGAADRANLATNNNMTYAGGFTGPATGTAGFATITGVENSVILEVFCDTTATLTKSGGGSIQVTNIEVDPEDGRGAIGTGSVCNGVAGAAAMTFTYTSPTRDSVYIGGRLNGSTVSSFGTGGNFSTANAGGDNVEFIVLNQ